MRWRTGVTRLANVHNFLIGVMGTWWSYVSLATFVHV